MIQIQAKIKQYLISYFEGFDSYYELRLKNFSEWTPNNLYTIIVFYNLPFWIILSYSEFQTSLYPAFNPTES